MHDELAMRELKGAAHLQRAFDSGPQPEPALCAVFDQRLALDVFHDEIGTPVLRQAAVEQARDIRVRQARQDLPLAHEARDHRLAVHAALDELERGTLVELSVRTLDEQDDSHATAPDLAAHAPVSDHRSGRRCGIMLARPRGSRGHAQFERLLVEPVAQRSRRPAALVLPAISSPDTQRRRISAERSRSGTSSTLSNTRLILFHRSASISRQRSDREDPDA